MVIHLRTKTDLINLVETHLSKRYVSILRTFHEGDVENLGAFKHIPLNGNCGWILKLTSKHKKINYLATVVNRLNICIYLIQNVPWKYWEGDKSDNKMYQGDNPILYKELRDVKNKSDETAF